MNTAYIGPLRGTEFDDQSHRRTAEIRIDVDESDPTRTTVGFYGYNSGTEYVLASLEPGDLRKLHTVLGERIGEVLG